MKKTRKAKRKPHGTLRRSRRYRRGGYSHNNYTYRPRQWMWHDSVTVGGKRRKSKRRSSRKKRGGTTTTSLRLSPHVFKTHALGQNVS